MREVSGEHGPGLDPGLGPGPGPVEVVALAVRQCGCFVALYRGTPIQGLPYIGVSLYRGTLIWGHPSMGDPYIEVPLYRGPFILMHPWWLELGSL